MGSKRQVDALDLIKPKLKNVNLCHYVDVNVCTFIIHMAIPWWIDVEMFCIVNTILQLPVFEMQCLLHYECKWVIKKYFVQSLTLVSHKFVKFLYLHHPIRVPVKSDMNLHLFTFLHCLFVCNRVVWIVLFAFFVKAELIQGLQTILTINGVNWF